MPTILIVDDEKHTRESIRDFIPWTELGINRVVVAKNGVEALEEAEKAHPEIILCDVRMPRMDGIEFAGHVRNLLPRSRILFLSGFADKSYLKSAIELRADRYVEKPINYTELTQAVRDALHLYLKENAREQEIHQLRERLDSNLPHLFNDWVYGLLSEGGHAAFYDRLLTEASDHLPGFPRRGHFLCASARLYWHKGHNAKKDRLTSFRSRLSTEAELGTVKLLVAASPDGDELVLILADSAVMLPSLPMGLFRRILEKTEQLSDGDFTVALGIGLPVQSPSSLRSSYRQAADLSQRSFYHGFGQIYSEGSPLEEDFIPDETFTDSFFTLFPEKMDELELLLKDLGKRLANESIYFPDAVKKYFGGLLMETAFEARRSDAGGSGLSQKVPVFLKDIQQSMTLEAMLTHFFNAVKALREEPEQSERYNEKIREAIGFIREHYMEPELSLQAIADGLYLNQNYLCTLFKKQTGKTLNDFITETRLEAARHLLRKSGARMYEIAEKTGFGDPNYFATLFKKYTGLTPTQYKHTGGKSGV